MKHRIDILECYISDGEIVTSDGDVNEFSSPEDFPTGESFSLNTNCQFIIKYNQKIYYIEFESQSIYDEDWEDEEPNRREFDLTFHFELKEELTIGDIETNNLKFENINDEEFISKFYNEISEDIIPLCGDDLLEEKPFVEFIITSNEKDNVIKEYHENGNLKGETELNSEGIRHGITKIYHENGQLQIQVEFTNGKQNNGEIISFHDNGNKARCVNLLDENYEGDFIEWHKNGVISRKGVYENDEIVEEQLWDEDNNPIDKKNEVIEQYKIKDDNPSSIGTGISESMLFKRDITGLMSYFEERPNMERLFNELTHFTRDGYTVEEYLDNTNIMDDEEVKTIIGYGFIDISGFLEDMLKIQENSELKKDYESCLKVSKILLK